jgi:hypothetical protein
MPLRTVENEPIESEKYDTYMSTSCFSACQPLQAVNRGTVFAGDFVAATPKISPPRTRLLHTFDLVATMHKSVHGAFNAFMANQPRSRSGV